VVLLEGQRLKGRMSTPEKRPRYSWPPLSKTWAWLEGKNWDQDPVWYPDGILDKPDEEAGRILLENRVLHELAKLGITKHSDAYAREFAAVRVIRASRDLDSRDADNSGMQALFRAISLAARGEFARAGRSYKQILREGAYQITLQMKAELAESAQQRRLEVTRKATAAAEQQAAERHEEWMPIARELREKNPRLSISELARRVAESIRKRGMMIDPPSTRTIRRTLGDRTKKPKK
jgi:hypothetical protein